MQHIYVVVTRQAAVHLPVIRLPGAHPDSLIFLLRNLHGVAQPRLIQMERVVNVEDIARQEWRLRPPRQVCARGIWYNFVSFEQGH